MDLATREYCASEQEIDCQLVVPGCVRKGVQRFVKCIQLNHSWSPKLLMDVERALHHMPGIIVLYCHSAGTKSA